MLVLVAVAVLDWVGVGRSALRFGGWAVAMHLWFVPVYLALLTLTPVALAAHRRWGLLVPAVLAIAVVVVDVAARVWHLPINQLSQLPAVLGSDLSGRDLLARWDFGVAAGRC